MIDVVIIGGGVSGLTTAFELARKGRSVVVLERQTVAGGNAISERVDGFLMEHGPSSVSAAAGPIAALRDRIGIEHARVELTPNVRFRYLTGKGRINAIPTHPLGFMTASYLSLAGRARLIAECLVPRRDGGEDESVAAFFHRRFGKEFAELVIDPLVAGIFAGRARETSMRAVFPKLVEFEERFGSAAIGAISRLRKGRGMPGRRLFSWRDGIASLPRALAAHLGDTLRTGVAVNRITPLPGGFRIDAGKSGTLQAKAVVIATQPHVAGSLLESMDREASAAAFAIPAPPLAVVFLGYRREQVAHPLDGIGYLTPEAEGRAVTGALFPSTMFPYRAPPGHVSLAAYIGGARRPELALAPEADLIDLARAEFVDLLGARGRPAVCRVRHWPRGLPQYLCGHQDGLSAIDGAEERWPGLFLTGNYFTGPGITACVTRASEVAGRAGEFLSARETAGESRSLPAINTG